MITLQQIQEYRENPAYSQSDLRHILSKGTKGFKPSLAILMGSYLDCKLTCPHLAQELYYISDIKRPTQTIQDLCKSLYEWLDKDTLLIDPWKPNLEEHVEQIEEWINFESYYANRPRTRVKTFIEEASEWWAVFIQKGDKQIITSIEDLETDLIIIKLKNEKDLEWLWGGDFQKPFYWIEEGIECKGLGDIVLENTYVDLKYTTCESLHEWWKVCTSLNYPFQMAFYKSGLGVDKCYWLVVNKNWHQLIEVNELMLAIGKWGYDKYEKIKIGKVEYEVNKRTYGYIDALYCINSTENSEESFNYLKYLI